MPAVAPPPCPGSAGAQYSFSIQSDVSLFRPCRNPSCPRFRPARLLGRPSLVGFLPCPARPFETFAQHPSPPEPRPLLPPLTLGEGLPGNHAGLCIGFRWLSLAPFLLSWALRRPGFPASPQPAGCWPVPSALQGRNPVGPCRPHPLAARCSPAPWPCAPSPQTASIPQKIRPKLSLASSYPLGVRAGEGEFPL